MDEFVQTNESMPRYWMSVAIILLEGFVTISLEILTIRQLVPVAGNSVIVTSLIIGVFLLFLAYGYLKGGRYEASYTHVLKKNFTRAAIGLGIGVSCIFIEYFFFYAGKNFNGNVLMPLIAYLLLVTAPIVYWLGQTVPITFNLFKQERAGLIGSRVLHISTLGSFLGAILTAVLLFNYVGVAWTVFINFVILFLLVVILINIQKEWWRLVSLLVIGYFIY